MISSVVIGDPIEHSLSPLFHSAGYKALGIEKEYSFSASRVTPEELKDFFLCIRKENVRGISVTIPHKTSVISYLDVIDPVAKQIGAINTVVNDGKVLTGYNTDVYGVVAPLEKITSIAGKSVAILGAGGAARAAAFGLKSKGAQVAIFNRTKERAEILASELDVLCDTLKQTEKIRACDILINSTSVGMTPQVATSPVPNSAFRKDQIVFDLVYRPLKTKFLQEAEKAGARTISGTQMFVHQGSMQFELYVSRKAPLAQMERALLDYLTNLDDR